MTDEQFWHTYFSLTRDGLPAKAFDWGPDDVLPRVPREWNRAAFG